jgi:hypothetical protein
MGEIEIIIRKPIYNNFVYIRAEKVELARARKWNLKITTPAGSGTYTADEWIKGSKTMDKVFLRPDEPMRLIGNNLIVGHTPELKGKAKKIADAWSKYNSLTPEQRAKV